MAKEIMCDSFRLMNVDGNRVIETFKKEWSKIEIEGVEYILDKFVKNNILSYSKYFFGTCYTSTSDIAGLYVSSNITIEGRKLIVFAIRGNEQIVAICKDENEIFYFYELEY
jgi:hypothetical protein